MYRTDNPAADGLTDEQYEELTRIADEAFEKERT